MSNFLTYVLAIACLMLANTIITSAEKIISKEFDYKILFKGILRYLMILAGVVLIFAAGNILPSIEIMEGLTLVNMLEVLSLSLVIKYGIACYEALKAIFEVDLH